MEREVCRRSDPRYYENPSRMRVFYTPRYYADIGEGHVFPIRKFELVRDRLFAEGTLSPSEIIEPREAAVEDVLLVHTLDYVTRLRAGALARPPDSARVGRRPRRSSGQRHGLHLRAGRGGLHLLDARREELPALQAALLARRGVARQHGRRRVPRRAHAKPSARLRARP